MAREKTKEMLVMSDLVLALEGVWGQIRDKFRDCPPVVMTVASGAEGIRSAKNGHFGSERWRWAADEKARAHEVLIAGERIKDGVEGVLSTLLHEAAHAISHHRGVEDTSQNGRYHNRKFLERAEAVGLMCSRGNAGFNRTELDGGTAERYDLANLEAACVAFRETPLRPPSKSNNLLKAECRCGRKVRLSRTEADRGEVLCGACESPFEVQED